MDPAICLRSGPVPSPPLLFKDPNMSTASRVLTKPHFSFISSPLSVSNGSILRQTRQTFSRHVVYALDRFSTPSKEDHYRGNDNVIVRGTVGASLVMACVVAIMGCRAIAVPSTSLAMEQSPVEPTRRAAPFGAKGTLKSLFAVGVELATSAKAKKRYKIFPKWKASKFDNVPKMVSAEEADELKMEAAKLIKAGRSDEAETQLRKAFENAKEGRTYLDESAYNVQMVLVEILMAQGKYEEASKCECLQITRGGPSDGRLYLYKAIISTMMDDIEQSKIYWQGFIEKVVTQSSPFDRKY